MNDQEKDFLEDTEIEENVKPNKKKLSEQKLQHQNIQQIYELKLQRKRKK